MVEGCDALTAFRRSAALTRGNRWRILWINVLVALPAIALMFVTWRLSGAGVPPRAPLPLWTPAGAISFLLQMALGILLPSSAAILYAERSAVIDPAPHAEMFS